MEAASPASIPSSMKTSLKCSILPAPPEAITGILRFLLISLNNSKSKPFLTPSVSMLFTTSSPAPFFSPSSAHWIASIPVFILPPLEKTQYYATKGKDKPPNSAEDRL